MRKLIHATRTLLFAVLVAGVGVLNAQAQADELAPGTKMPLIDHILVDIDGAQRALAGVKGTKGTVVAFWSNDCPWVTKYEERFLELARAYRAQGFGFVVVNANDAVAFPKEAAAEGQKRARAEDYPMPYLVDNGSQLATAFGASRTPHVYLFDADDTLVYVGTIDDSPGDPDNVSEHYLRDALDAVGAGSPVPVARKPAFGCTIKFQG